MLICLQGSRGWGKLVWTVLAMAHSLAQIWLYSNSSQARSWEVYQKMAGMWDRLRARKYNPCWNKSLSLLQGGDKAYMTYKKWYNNACQRPIVERSQPFEGFHYDNSHMEAPIFRSHGAPVFFLTTSNKFLLIIVSGKCTHAEDTIDGLKNVI